jgi:hypothetical protein
MSTSLSAVQQTLFDQLVKAEYRSSGFMLKEAVRTKNDVIGATVDFRKVGQVISVATGYGQSVTPQDPGYTKATATLQKYTTPTFVDSVQELTVNFDTRMENAMLVAEAMGRRSDQICIDALDADPGSTIANGGTNFTYAKYREMMEFFEDNAVPLGDRFVAMSANNFRSLLSVEQFINADYTRNMVLDNARVKEFLGFNLIIIPDMTEGGLPKSGNIRTALAWHKMSTGMAVGHNFRTEINYLPRETSWLINGVFSAGAVVIDNRGVLAIDCDETA